MAEAATYLTALPITVQATATAIVRGVRVTRNSSGLVAVQDATAKGDYVTMHDIAASDLGAAVAMGSGSKMPALASEATVAGDLAYSAAAGKFSKTSASAVLCGRWTLGASGDGVLGEVQLFDLA